MGEDRLAWEANEGIRVSRLLAAVRARRLTASAAALIAGLETATPSVQEAPAASASAASIADGGLSFTVPLQVTIGLGAVAPAVVSAASADGAGAAVAAPPPAEGARLRAALVDLDAARARPYYDAAADDAARAAYYHDIDEHAAPADLFTALSKLLESTHRQRPKYDPMHMVYPWVDLQPEGDLTSIYSGKAVDPETFIREDAEVEAAHAARLRELTETVGPGRLEEALDLLETALPYNCEHVVPQSWFGKQEPMRGDLHHLFACASRCNSFRGNYPYFEFALADEAVQSDCGRREDDGFEPVAGRGTVARATLYFLLRYPGFVGDEQRELHVERVAMLRAWHAAHPVEDYERHRNMAIAEIQGNRNPLIDHPEWAAAIGFEAAFAPH